ncbi:lysophospholipid acyltransferase family protein [soil metagenome]
MARRERRGAALTFCVGLLRPLLTVLTRRRWSGTEHLPASGGFLFAANHISYADPFLFAHFVHDSGYAPHFLAKQSLLELPVVGRLVRATGQIPVHRETDQAAQAYRDAVAAVRRGQSVIVYPEGTLTRDPDLWPMVGKTGAVRIALDSGCPVLPCAQWGAHELLPPYARRPRLLARPVNQVLVGPPVDLDDLRGRPVTAELLRAATARVMAAITDLLGQLRGQTPPAVRFDPHLAGLPTTGDPYRSTARRRGTHDRQEDGP